MSVTPRPRVFGAKPVPAQWSSFPAAARPASPVELHHASAKLVTWTLISAVFVMLSVCIIAGGGLGANYHGRDAAIVHLLGPQGTIALFVLFRLGRVALGLAYLRLLPGADHLAASARPYGLVINGVWGHKTYAWQDGLAVRLHITRARAREIPFICIERSTRGQQLLPVCTVAGGRASVEAWIGATQAYLRR